MTEDDLDLDLDETRQKVIDDLCEDFAQDRMDVDEFERRVDLAHKAETAEELRAVLKDLPAGTRMALARGETTKEDAVRVPGGLVQASIAAPDLVQERQLVLSVLGGTSRKGAWTPARHVYCITLVGGTQLDFREALLAPGVTEVTVFCKMGGVDIIVPPGLQVDFSGTGIMGGFDMSDEVTPVQDPDAPILRVNGIAFCGGVDVTVREPGETAGGARRRRRMLRRERRRMRRRLKG